MMADDEEDRHDSEAMVSVPARGVLEQRAFDALETDIQQVPMRKQLLKAHFSTLSTSLIFPVFSMSLNVIRFPDYQGSLDCYSF
jgi:hypothetical protein